MVKFYPKFITKDIFGFITFVGCLVLVTVFWYPNVLGHPDNYIRADNLVTPKHIVPEWYFLPFYAILRSIPDKLGGVVAMIGAILILLLLHSCIINNIILINHFKFFSNFYITEILKYLKFF